MHGIGVAAPTLDFTQMMKRKGEVVGATTKGVEFLFKKNKIATFQVQAALTRQVRSPCWATTAS